MRKLKEQPDNGKVTDGGSLTLGSLFDGIGVFPLAASRHGIVPRWASEIEKAPISITRRHFPRMEHLGDITKLDGGAIPAVHIITFGSPCQNLSKMGDRTGLAGAKSSLFYQAIRIIREMRDATGDQFPIITVWENVGGAMVSNDRLDHLAVLRAFLPDAEIPMPASGRWAMPEWCEGDALTWPGGSWTPSIGQDPGWPGGSVSSSWRILEGGVLERYCLSPGQCSYLLSLAHRAGCPPPKEIEALLFKQGGVYPSSCPSSPSVCGKPPSGENGPSSRTALERQMTLFPHF